MPGGMRPALSRSARALAGRGLRAVTWAGTRDRRTRPIRIIRLGNRAAGTSAAPAGTGGLCADAIEDQAATGRAGHAINVRTSAARVRRRSVSADSES